MDTITDTEERECLICKKKTFNFKWSFTGSGSLPVCGMHEDYTSYIKFETPGFKNISMGLRDPLGK